MHIDSLFLLSDMYKKNDGYTVNFNLYSLNTNFPWYSLVQSMHAIPWTTRVVIVKCQNTRIQMSRLGESEWYLIK
jgi:hypothetical protein